MADGSRQSGHLIRFLRELSRSRDLASLARVVLEQAMSIVPGAQRGSFMLLNRDTNCYEFRAAIGWPLAKLRQVTIPTSQILQQITHGDRPAIIREPYQQDRAHGLHELADTFQALFGSVRAILSFPISCEGEILAYLNLDSIEDPDAFQDEDLDRLELVREELSISLRSVIQRERLAQLEQFFRTLFEKLADAVYITEFDGTILRANQAACAQTGYAAEKLTDMNIMRDLAHEEPAVTYEKVIHSLQAGEVVRFEEVKRRKDGTLYITDCHVAVVEYQGRQVTLSINRDVTAQRKAEGDLERRNQELEALLSASRALTATLELDELLKRIQQQATALIPCDSFFVALLDKQQWVLRLELMVERGVSLGKRTIPADPQRSLTGWVAHAGEPLLIGNVQEEDLPTEFQQVGELSRSWLGVPLIAAEEPIGVMSVQSLPPDAFTKDHLRLLSTFAGLAAAAVRNAELHTGVASLQSKLLAVERAARGMKLAETRKELYAKLLSATEEIFGYGRSAILEASGDELKIALAHGREPTLDKRLTLNGPGITVAAWNARTTQYVPDVSVDDRYVAGLSDVKTELAIPFGLGEQPAGVVDVQSPEVGGVPPEDRNLLEILTAHMAVTLAGLDRLDSMRALSGKLQRLHLAVNEMQRCQSIDELCQATVRTASDVLGMSLCNVGLAEGDVLVPRASSGGAKTLGCPMRRGEGVTGKMWETGQTLWGKVCDFPIAKPASSDIKAFISVPVGKEGVFQAISDSEDAFSPSDVSLAEILAEHLHTSLQRVQLEAALRDQATRDALTGLHNRRYLTEVLERELERSSRYGHPLSVIMADIDHFKQVNDRLGHLRGDQVLREIADILRENVRASDYIFRYGGEEFVILLPETATRAERVIERLGRSVRDWAASSGLGVLEFGLSMGSAVWDPHTEEGISPERLLQRADAMLYSFKQRSS